MKQKRIILDTLSPENAISKLPQSIKFYINTSNITNRDNRDKLEYKSGSIPFSITTYNKDGLTPPDFIDLLTSAKDLGERITKKFILSNYYVYKIADYGNQSLSPGISDFTLFCYDSSGYKLPQYMTAIIKNYTTKEAFILIKKKNLIGNEDISVVVDFKRNPIIKVSREPVSITRDSGTFKINLKDSLINDIESMAFYIKDGDKYYELKNSESFFSIKSFKYSTATGSKFVTRQDSYFNTLEFDITTNYKKYHDIEIELDDNLPDTITTIYVRDRKNYFNFFSGNYNKLRSELVLYRLDNLSIYKYITPNRLVKLNAGIDYYINADDKIIIDGADEDIASTEKYELFIRPRAGEVYSFYSETPGGTFNFSRALYDSYIVNWNPVVADSNVLVFDNGKFSKVQATKASLPNTTTAGTLYIVEDITWGTNTGTPATMTAVVEESPFEFDNFNDYQLLTDPYATTYGETAITETKYQEVYLYDTDLNMKLDTSEPYITDNGDITIQGIADPETDTGILTTVHDNYEDFQTDDGSGKSKIINTIYSNTKAQAIEAQIVKLKKNFKSIFGNSSITYSNYSSLVNAGEFMFLVLKGTSGNTFTLTYRDGANNIIKKEYNCTFDDSGLYISIPFFLHTYGNTETLTKFEVDQNVSQYYIFR